jgi:hypothetical protein
MDYIGTEAGYVLSIQYLFIPKSRKTQEEGVWYVEQYKQEEKRL